MHEKVLQSCWLLDTAGIGFGVETGEASDEREEAEIVMHGAVVIAEAGEIVRSGASACAKRASSGSEQRCPSTDIA
jgi:hypothetical protein